MRRFALAVLVGLPVALSAALPIVPWGAAPAAAQAFEGCGRTEVKLAGGAMADAERLAAQAAAAVGDTADFARWFGAWTPAAGEGVRANLKAVRRALASAGMVAACRPPGAVDCKDGVYAYVSFDRPGVLHLCGAFFAMPSMRDAAAGVGDQRNGTREGTIVHEVSHFPDVAGTGDACYARAACAALARRDPRTAARTADSYQYFAEDVSVAIAAAKD